jgi:hypothetical protein
MLRRIREATTRRYFNKQGRIQDNAALWGMSLLSCAQKVRPTRGTADASGKCRRWLAAIQHVLQTFLRSVHHHTQQLRTSHNSFHLGTQAENVCYRFWVSKMERPSFFLECVSSKQLLVCHHFVVSDIGHRPQNSSLQMSPTQCPPRMCATTPLPGTQGKTAHTPHSLDSDLLPHTAGQPSPQC